MKKHIITIAGRPGSGKSTTAKTVAAKLGYVHFSSGDLFRELAKERGIDVLQANLSAEANAEIDHLVDGRLQKIGKQEDERVIDSRTGWHWMPESFKVFLDLDLEVAAKRILKALEERQEVNENIPNDPIQYAQVLKDRLDSENRRYKSLYNIDPGDMTNYDLVVDTSSHNLEQVVEIILKNFREWIENDSL
jgi:predicted cytidylate kinase